MKQIIANDKKRVGDWVALQMKRGQWLTPHAAIGLEQDGCLIAGVVIDSYKKDTRCSIHCAGTGKRWLNREFLFVVFDYVFRQLNCQAVVNPVDSSNRDSIRFTEHLGFVGHAIPEAELIVFTLPRARCRWLDLKE